MSALGQLSKIAVLNWAFGSLAHLLGFPPLIGYIANGFVVGPWVAEYIKDPSALYILHEAGNVGLLLLMFFTGMEINIIDFLDVKKASVSLRAVIKQFLMSALLILVLYLIYCVISVFSNINTQTTINHWILSLMSSAYSFHEVIFPKIVQILALIISLIFLSSTAIPIKLLESQNYIRTKLGQAIVSILVMQDIALIPIIIGLKSFTYATTLCSVLVKLCIALTFIYLVKIAMQLKHKIKNLLPKTISNFITKEMSGIFIVNKALVPVALISFALLCAWIAEYAGLSDIYGAFIAGLIVGNLSSEHSIISTMTPIVDIMSIPVFMKMGVTLNLNHIKQHWKMVSCMSLSIILLKFLFNYAIIKKSQSKLYFTNLSTIQASLLLSQVSEFSFCIIDIISRNTPANQKHYISMIESTIMICLTLGSILIVSCKQLTTKYGTYLEREDK